MEKITVIKIIDTLKITRRWIEVHKQDIEVVGMPICCHCGKPLRLGSEADHFWPYYDDTSHHVTCHRRLGSNK